MAAPTVGLTGGIASGKSTVARLFADLGIPCVDADEIAREVVAPGTAGLDQVVARFGETMLAPDGSLDRKKLADHVFDDRLALAELNAITHPLIGARSAERMRELAATDVPYVLYQAALLVENGLHRLFAALVVVAASEETQLRRLMERDGLDAAAAMSRLAAQAPLAAKLEAADFVIDNDGDLDETLRRTHEVHEQLLLRLSRSPR